MGKIKIDDRENEKRLINVKKKVDTEIQNISLAASLKKNKVINLVDETLELNIDPDMLQFIIRNLLTNANKFTTEGKITLFSDKDDQYITLTMNDTGIGMTGK